MPKIQFCARECCKPKKGHIVLKLDLLEDVDRRVKALLPDLTGCDTLEATRQTEDDLYRICILRGLEAIEQRVGA